MVGNKQGKNKETNHWTELQHLRNTSLEIVKEKKQSKTEIKLKKTGALGPVLRSKFFSLASFNEPNIGCQDAINQRSQLWFILSSCKYIHMKEAISSSINKGY